MRKWRLLIGLLIAGCCWHVQAAESEGEEIKRQLLRELSMTRRDSTRLEVMSKLVYISKKPQVESYYIDKMLNEAIYQKNPRYQCLAYMSRIIRAYNMYDFKTASHWMNKLEPIALKSELYDILFRAKRCVIDLLMVSEQYEREEREAMQMLQQAQKLKNNIGIVSAYHCLANVYTMTYRKKQSIKALEKAYPLSLQIAGNYSIEISGTLVSCYQDLNDRGNWLKWIRIQEKRLQETVNADESMRVKLQGFVMMNYVYYLIYYTETGNLPLAEKYLLLAEQKRTKGYGTFELHFHQSRYQYFEKIQNLDQALVEVEALINLFRERSPQSCNLMEFQKASLLRQMGRIDEALALYKSNYIDKDSIQVAMLNKQTEELKQSYLNDQLLLEGERIDRYVQTILLVLVGIGSLILIYFVFHVNRVRKRLRHTEHEMRQMAQHMEQANVAKELFLSTISSAISIPLNAVVQGSLKLASDTILSELERCQISQEMKRTSVQLMKLINNILTLSRLEAGMMKVKETLVDFRQLVSNAVDFLPPERRSVITLSLPPAQDKKFLVYADESRLIEMVNNLLGDEIDAPNQHPLFITLKQQGEQIEVRVEGSLLVVDEKTQDMDVINDINRFLVELFGGEYHLVSATATAPAYIYFCLPLVKGPHSNKVHLELF